MIADMPPWAAPMSLTKCCAVPRKVLPWSVLKKTRPPWTGFGGPPGRADPTAGGRPGAYAGP